MCGVAGFFAPAGFVADDAAASAVRMRDQLVHRGPDDSGLWVDAAAGIALAHRRLSIIDLSLSGHQPMMSASGRYCLAFNGEIYNHLELREFAEAKGNSSWRGASDTESLLAAIDAVGLVQALQASVGMFALALWDRQERVLHLARDRMGEKPLFYGWQRGVLLFGSELKGLRTHPAFEADVDPDALPDYLQSGYITAPRTVWRGIRKLLPGTTVCFSSGGVGSMPEPTPYWTFMDVALRGQAAPFMGSDQEAIDALESVLGQAVTGQMVADVPLGAFLSGGIDSSTVVALMQARSSRLVRTFSIGFHEDGYDEAQHARAVAQHLGTDHTELYVTAPDAQRVVPLLPRMFDEPFGDSSAIPTYLVSHLARQHVTVSLSGDGGDELFGGYQRYYNSGLLNLWSRARGLPAWMARLAGALSGVDALRGFVAGERICNRLALMSALLQCPDQLAAYGVSIRQWDPARARRALGSSAIPPAARARDLDLPLHQMMALDSVTYLPDDILTKVDRTAMAVSLETRVPLLDHRVVELAWCMPPHFKSRNGSAKWLLKQVAFRHVPPALLERPKMGFGVPVDEWIRGPLRDWAEDLLSESALRNEGLLDPKPIRLRWRQHLKRQRNWRDSLWTVLMWQAWRRGSVEPHRYSHSTPQGTEAAR